jgi:hypothetical protein
LIGCPVSELRRPATLTVEAGALFETAAHLYVGRDGTGNSFLNIEGGTVNVATTVYLGHGTNATQGFITLSGGGRLTAGGLYFYNTSSVVDVRQGSVLLAGDQTAAVNGYVAAGNVIGYRGLGTPVVDYNTSNPGYTTIQAVPPEDGYDAWSVSFNENIGTEANDYDGDSMNNLYEYALNGDPTDPADTGTDPIFIKAGDAFEYSHLKRTDNPDLVYTVQLRTNLLSGVWTNAAGLSSQTNVIGGGYDEVVHTIPADIPKAYIRLKITKP